MFTSGVVLKVIFATQWLASSLAKRKTVICSVAIMTFVMMVLFQLTARFLLGVWYFLHCSNMCYIVKIRAIVLNKKTDDDFTRCITILLGKKFQTISRDAANQASVPNINSLYTLAGIFSILFMRIWKHIKIYLSYYYSLTPLLVYAFDNSRKNAVKRQF